MYNHTRTLFLPQPLVNLLMALSFQKDGRRQWLDDAVVYMLQSSEAERRRGDPGTFDATELVSLPKSPKKKLLKESEKRKFRERVKAQFACDAESAQQLVPTACSRIGRLEAFSDDADLLFVRQEDETKRDKFELVPTIAALYRCPHLVRQLVVHSPVEKNVRRGADLFTPGIVGCSELAGHASRTWSRDLCGGPFAKGELVALVTPGKWAPFAVGRFAKSDQAMMEEGTRGTAVLVSFRKDPSSARNEEDTPPPQRIIENLEQLAIIRQLEIEENISKQRDREAAEAAARAAEAYTELGKNKRRLQKALRAVADLRLKDNLNQDQRTKLEREPAMLAELAAIEAAMLEPPPADPAESGESSPKPSLDETSSPPEQQPGDEETVLVEAPQLETSGKDEGVEDVAVEGEDVVALEGVEDAAVEDVDDRFRDAFLTVLAASFPPRSRGKPRLVAEIFAETAKLAGSSVKKTRWKKADRFVNESLQGALVTKERSRGVTEIVEVDWSMTPDFDHVAWPQEESTERTVLKTATKRGGRCTVSVRRVRNKNCTFVDGLDGWGYSEADMRAIAAVFRARFSASASVSPRKGTEHQPASRQQFWSIMVQGKYAEQIANALKNDLKVTDVQVAASKGVSLNKLVRTANV